MLLPILDWREVREAEVFAALHFGDVDDLAGVVGEVFVDVGDGVEAAQAEALD